MSSGVRIITRSEDRVEFNVETVYKGDAPSRWSVSVNATDCGYVFSDGERYTVFVTADGRTNLCLGNVRGAIDPAILAIALGTVLAIVTVRLRRSRSA